MPHTTQFIRDFLRTFRAIYNEILTFRIWCWRNITFDLTILLTNVKDTTSLAKEQTSDLFRIWTAFNWTDKRFLLNVNDIDDLLLFAYLKCKEIAFWLTDTYNIIRLWRIRGDLNLTAELLAPKISYFLTFRRPNLNYPFLQCQKLFFFVQKDECLRCLKPLNTSLNIGPSIVNIKLWSFCLNHDSFIELL